MSTEAATKKNRNYGTWGLLIFIGGLILLMVLLSIIKNNFF
ncbi:MAG: hypothetical protein ACOYXB_01255 [Bacteroidota bacterium]